MKTKSVNPIEIEPEIISELSEEQTEEIQGGRGSCHLHTCNPTKQV
jgi:hypothetical protein